MEPMNAPAVPQLLSLCGHSSDCDPADVFAAALDRSPTLPPAVALPIVASHMVARCHHLLDGDGDEALASLIVAALEVNADQLVDISLRLVGSLAADPLLDGRDIAVEVTLTLADYSSFPPARVERCAAIAAGNETRPALIDVWDACYGLMLTLRAPGEPVSAVFDRAVLRAVSPRSCSSS